MFTDKGDLGPEGDEVRKEQEPDHVCREQGKANLTRAE